MGKKVKNKGLEDLEQVKAILSNHRVKLEGQFFRLTRERDGEGDTGELYPIERSQWKRVGEAGEILVGFSVTVGFYAWTTTPVTEISWVSGDKSQAKIKTLNSVYSVVAVDPNKK